ncbi:hypothetical protein N7495_003436 [Penicillium taxi]|uniref:uncharacterized protein n=1 Tax=Penicillium taxi TaxID=168475 RepID=UPI002544EF02|nr:uncharacterized protein N7495_003436 [Penicillium taxi]KAJ5902908.1 hypothetical protein N7495_003436 [Penicillium taxi]
MPFPTLLSISERRAQYALRIRSHSLPALTPIMISGRMRFPTFPTPANLRHLAINRRPNPNFNFRDDFTPEIPSHVSRQVTSVPVTTEAIVPSEEVPLDVAVLKDFIVPHSGLHLVIDRTGDRLFPFRDAFSADISSHVTSQVPYMVTPEVAKHTIKGIMNSKLATDTLPRKNVTFGEDTVYDVVDRWAPIDQPHLSLAKLGRTQHPTSEYFMKCDLLRPFRTKTKPRKPHKVSFSRHVNMHEAENWIHTLEGFTHIPQQHSRMQHEEDGEFFISSPAQTPAQIILVKKTIQQKHADFLVNTCLSCVIIASCSVLWNVADWWLC